ncbi:MAG: DNA primase [Candidatus Saganbacteria bacterium]|nr:DNA primase [Candidatus Saganbacteria bacterium]
MIPAEIIEEIRNKADIVKVVSEYVKIKKRGKNYLGSCPFHSEKDPSFTVSPDKQIFHCFGCQEGGNVFAFLMKIENIGFAEAVAELGTRLGIAVPQVSGSGASKTLRDKLYQIAELAAKFFEDNLKGPAGNTARTYLQHRAIEFKTVKQFRLGLAPEGWDNLFKYLVSRGADPKLIEKCGLVLAREGKNGYYDRFRNRLIFPICDPRGRVVAFGGRGLGNEEPKYLNSPDTPIYHKGSTLFGLDLSRDAIKRAGSAIMVEGNFDLVTPFQAGFTNIVASMGTALTDQQCKLLSRYCDTVILAFDADSAGGLAAERSTELFRSHGLKVKVAQLSGGKDPDEIINKAGKDAFGKMISDSLPYLEFRVRRALSRHDLKEIESRSRALKEIAKVLAAEKDEFTVREYAKLAAQALGTDPDTVQAEVKRLGQYAGAKGFKSLSRVTAKPNSKVVEAEKNLIALIARNKEGLALFQQYLTLDDFSATEARTIIELLQTAKLGQSQEPAHFLLENLPDEAARKYLSALLVRENLSQTEQFEVIFADCVKVLKDEKKRQRVADLKAEIKTAEKSQDAARASELLSLLQTEIS